MRVFYLALQFLLVGGEVFGHAFDRGHEAFVLAHGFGPARIGKVGEVARAFDFSSEPGIPSAL